MAIGKGSAFVLSKNSTSVADCTVNTLHISYAHTETTNKESQGGREILPSSGVYSIEISTTAWFSSDTTHAAILAMSFSGASDTFELDFDDTSNISGAFVVSDLSTGNSSDGSGGQSFEFTLQNSGPVTYTPPS
jgi:predicted secreted protein